MEYHINTVLANGLAMAKVYNLTKVELNLKTETNVDELTKLDKAFNDSVNELKVVYRTNTLQREYLEIQLMMLSDAYLKQKIVKKVEEGYSSYEAINIVMDEYTASLKDSASSYLSERENDFVDIKHRLIMSLAQTDNASLEEKSIVIADEIYPSFFIKNQKNIAGIIVKKGGYTSHCAIMARSLDIPFVVFKEDININDNDIIYIDTQKQVIVTELSKEDYLEKLEYINKIKNEGNESVINHDDYLFLANISSNEQIDKVLANGFDGVGLYRTEMIFMMSNRPYTKEEQKDIYLTAVKRLKGKRVVFRTFDIGDDKNLSYLKSYKKGIDNYINNPEIFEDQIRALLEANIYGDIRIMFPMITSNEEFNYLRDWVLRINDEINGNKVLIGMMLETKRAINNILEFKNVDFISVGTNDLTLELYNINRMDGLDKVNLYLDDLLEKLSKVVTFCKDNNICFSVCGELAGDLNTAVSLYSIGIKNLSVNPGAINVLNLAYQEYKKNV